MDPIANPTIQRAYRTILIVAYAVLASVILCALAVEMLIAIGYRGALPQLPDTVRVGVLALGFGLYIPIRFIRERMLGGDGARTALLAVVASERHAALFRASILVLVLSETAALMGLVLFLLSGERWDFYALFGLSLFYLVLHFPRMADWERWERSRAGRR